MRVVSHTCSNTEIVCALGAADLLVGVDDHSDFPAEVVAGLPRIGPDLGVDVERVKELDPDLVLTSLTVPGHERIVEALEREKLPILVLRPLSLADVLDDIARIARAIGRTREGEVVVDRLRAEMTPRAPSFAEPPALLVEWWPKPVIVPGKRSWVTDMIRIAGGRNPWAGHDGESTPVDDRSVLDAAPDAVVISWCGVEAHKYRPDIVYRRTAWEDLPAIRNGQVHCVSEAWIGRPGPRLADGIRALRGIVEGLHGAGPETSSPPVTSRSSARSREASCR